MVQTASSYKWKMVLRTTQLATGLVGKDQELLTDLFSLLESWTFKMRHKPAEHVISRLAHVCITWRQRRHGEAQATSFHELSTVHLVIYEAEQFCQRTLFCFRATDLSKTENKQYHKEELITRFHL